MIIIYMPFHYNNIIHSIRVSHKNYKYPRNDKSVYAVGREGANPGSEYPPFFEGALVGWVGR